MVYISAVENKQDYHQLKHHLTCLIRYSCYLPAPSHPDQVQLLQVSQFHYSASEKSKHDIITTLILRDGSVLTFKCASTVKNQINTITVLSIKSNELVSLLRDECSEYWPPLGLKNHLVTGTSIKLCSVKLKCVTSSHRSTSVICCIYCVHTFCVGVCLRNLDFHPLALRCLHFVSQAR